MDQPVSEEERQSLRTLIGSMHRFTPVRTCRAVSAIYNLQLTKPQLKL